MTKLPKQEFELESPDGLQFCACRRIAVAVLKVVYYHPGVDPHVTNTLILCEGCFEKLVLALGEY